MGISDDAFKAFAKQVEQEELERANKKTTGGFEFEPIKWVGIPDVGQGVKIIRALGEAPDSKVNAFTSRTVRYSKIKDDKGKEMRVILPMGEEAFDHIMWKIINRVLDVEWVNKEKIFVNKLRNPEIYNMVAKNSNTPGTDKHKYDKGWTGRDMFLMNCIDRDPVIYAWSKENKHTVLLSKGINVIKDLQGNVREFAEPGIPAFGFTNILATSIFKYYGDWNNYDMAIEKTPVMTSPYKITHATKHREEVPEFYHSQIVDGPLTEEELSWARYDLDKLFGVTSYTKLFNRLGKSINKIDLALGTHFAEELRSLAETEKVERAAKGEDVKDEEELQEVMKTATMAVGRIPPASSSATTTGATEPVKAPVPVTRTRSSNTPKGYDFLTEDEKKLIVKMEHVEGDFWNIEYDSNVPTASCTVCKTLSPEDFATCPGCGSLF